MKKTELFLKLPEYAVTPDDVVTRIAPSPDCDGLGRAKILLIFDLENK